MLWRIENALIKKAISERNVCSENANRETIDEGEHYLSILAVLLTIS